MTSLTQTTNNSLQGNNTRSAFTSLADDKFLNKIQGENGDYMLSTSGQPLLDLFFQSVRTLSISGLRSLLNKCYEDYKGDEKAMRFLIKQIFHMRAIRGMGKGEKTLFHVAFLWLFQKYPATCCHLLSVIPHYGSWQDLNIIAFMAFSYGNSAKAGLSFENGDKFSFENGNYSMLENACAEEFAKQLYQDFENMEEPGNRGGPISMAGKWAPREGKKFKRLANLISRRLYDMRMSGTGPLASKSALRGTCQKYYRQVCSSLNKELNTPEVMMSAKQWSELQIKHFASVAFQKNLKAISDEDKDGKRKHPNDPERTALRERLMEDIMSKNKLNVKELEPHTLVSKAQAYQSPLTEIGKLVLNKSWDCYQEHVKNLLKESDTAAKTIGKLVPLCDVSGSMAGIPMQVAIALSLLITKFTDPDFRNRILTFESQPQWHKVDEKDTFFQQVQKLAQAPWGGSTNIEAALSMIFTVLEEMKDRNGSLNQEEVPNLIVFTDMQFDQAGGNRVSAWDTCYQRLEKKYKLLGVEPPRVIFWNLRASYVGNHAPVQSDQKNVQMLSGYNPSLFKAVLFGEEEEIIEEEDDEGNVVVKTQKVKLTPWETLVKVIENFPSQKIDDILTSTEEGVFSKQTSD